MLGHNELLFIIYAFQACWGVFYINLLEIILRKSINKTKFTDIAAYKCSCKY